MKVKYYCFKITKIHYYYNRFLRYDILFVLRLGLFSFELCIVKGQGVTFFFITSLWRHYLLSSS